MSGDDLWGWIVAVLLFAKVLFWLIKTTFYPKSEDEKTEADKYFDRQGEELMRRHEESMRKDREKR